MQKSALLLAALVPLILGPTLARAQDAPGEAGRHGEAIGDADSENDIRLQLNAGAALAYGNARNFALNIGSNFAVREGQHGFLLELGWIYGLAASREDPAMMMYDFGAFEENTNNLTGRLRYDFFVDSDNAIFGVARIRRDPFANLSPRLQGQLGYMRNLLREESHRFWVEVGGDFTYDSFADGALDVGGGTVSDDRSILSARFLVGYTNEINEILTWNSGLEALWSLVRAPAGSDLAHWRFEWINQFRSKIADWLQLSVDITARFDSQPPGQASPWNEQGGQPTQMFDLLTTLNLVGNFDLDGEPVAEEEEEAEACPVCAEPEPCPECAADVPVEEPLEEPVEEPVEEPAADDPAGLEPSAEPGADAAPADADAADAPAEEASEAP